MEVGGERLEEPPERTVADPALKSPMARLIRRIPIRQVFPRRARAQNPEDAIQHVAWIAPRATPSVAAEARLR
jgi:hypothetical protein